MKNKVAWLYALVGIAALVWAVSEWQSDARRIRRQLARLQDLIEKNGAESDLVAANQARQVGGLFTADFALELQPLAMTVTDRQQLMQVVLQYRRSYQQIGLDFRDRDLQVDPQLRRADLATTAVLTARDGGGFARESYRLRCEWTVEQNEWRLKRLVVLEIRAG